MSPVVITSLISGLCVAIPSVIATIMTNGRNKNLMLYRIDQLENKVNKHNNLIERVYKLESKIAQDEVILDEMQRRDDDGK